MTTFLAPSVAPTRPLAAPRADAGNDRGAYADDDDGALVTLAEAMRALDIRNHRTLAKWLARLDLEPPVRDAYDWRFRRVPRATVERIRAARAQMPTPQARAGERATSPRLPVRRDDSGLAITPTAAAGTITSRHTGAVRRAEAAGLPELPDGWIAVSTWCAAHGLNPRSVTRLIEQGNLPVPSAGVWRRGVNVIRQAYAPAAHLDASRKAARRWAGRFRACPTCAAGGVET